MLEQFVGRTRVRYAGWALAGAALLLGALALVPSGATGATPSTEYQTQVVRAPEIQAIGRYGESMVAAGDLNRDGTTDLFVAAIGLNAGGVNGAGRVYALSGRTREVLYAVDSPEPQANANFGAFIQAPGDVNDDGIADLVVGPTRHDVYTGTGAPCGAPEPNGCNERQGKAWVFSGANGNLIYDLDNPEPQAGGGFGSRNGTAGDITGDGRPDIIVGAPSNDQPAGCGEATPVPAGCRKDEGQAFIFNGATGQLVRPLNLPAEDRQPAGGTSLGAAVQSPGDVDGDTVADQQVDASGYPFYTGSGTPCGTPEPNGCIERVGRIYVFSGATGQVLRRIDHPFPETGAGFGFQDVTPYSPGDVTGDGRPDIFGSASNEGRFEGEGYVFNGVTGQLLYRLRAPSEQLGDTFFSMARTDYNKDGVPDLYVGRQALGTVPADQNGGSFIYDGRDGSLLKAFELPTEDRQTGIAGNFGPFLGYAVADIGDLNGDGEPDYVASSQRYDEGLVQDAGRLYFFVSNVPAAGPGPGGPGSGPGPGGGGGGLPAFGGCGALVANVIRGTAAGNSITGTPRADRIFAGTGGDVVDALAGSDCVDLGPGDDRGQGGLGDDLVVGGLGADRISGSSGDDRLRGSGANDRIDAGRGNDRAFGDPGNDVLLGGFGNDRLHGVSGNDRIGGSRGRDRINGGAGRDLIAGGSSNDRVSGDRGNDRINGNSGNDVLKGNSGKDRIVGGTGRDVVSAGSGSDRVDVRDGKRDRVNCGRGRDTVIADPKDRVSDNCERVVRRRA